VEGLVHVSDLGADYFQFDPVKHQMLGERTGQRFRLGDRVRVKLMKADLESNRIDFTLVQEGVSRGAASRGARRGTVEATRPTPSSQRPRNGGAGATVQGRGARKAPPRASGEAPAPSVQAAVQPATTKPAKSAKAPKAAKAGKSSKVGKKGAGKAAKVSKKTDAPKRKKAKKQ